mgnify:CR=1 FL=1
MGLLDGIRAFGSGIAATPRKLNEARYSHATVMVPIGEDPETGEEITISEDELRASFDQESYDARESGIFPGFVMGRHTFTVGTSYVADSDPGEDDGEAKP